MAKKRKKAIETRSDGLGVLGGMQATAEIISSDGAGATLAGADKAHYPTPDEWLERIHGMERWIEEKESVSRRISMAFYHGRINAKNVKNAYDASAILDNLTVNLIKSFIDTLLPNLYFKFPEIKCRALQGGGILARLDEDLLKHLGREMGVDDELEMAVFDAAVMGTGVLHYDFDADRFLARVRHIPLSDVVVSHPGRWRFSDQSWVAIRECLTLPQAQAAFGDAGLTANAEFSRPESPQFEDDETEYEEPPGGVKREPVFVYWTVYAKFGDERKVFCLAERGVGQDAATEAKFLKQRVYDELKAGSVNSENDEDYKSWRTEPDWAFALDKEEWPLSVLRFCRTSDRFFGEPDIAQLAPLVAHFNMLLERMSTRIRLAFTLKLFVDGMLDDKQLKEFLDSEDFKVIRVKAEGRPIRDIIQELELSGIPQDAYQWVDTLKNLFDEVSHFAELLRGGSERQVRSATEAAIRENYASLGIAFKQKKIDQLLTEMGRKLRKINAQLTPDSRALQFAKKETLEAGGDQAEIRKAWDIRSVDISRILLESDVEVELNSARKYTADEEIQKILGIYSALAQDINPQTGEPLLGAEYRRNWWETLLTLAQISDRERKLPSIEEIRKAVEFSMQMRQQQAAAQQAMAAQEGQVRERELRVKEGQAQGERVKQAAEMQNEAAEVSVQAMKEISGKGEGDEGKRGSRD